MTSDELTAAVNSLDPGVRQRALDWFTTVNPHWKGANWDDVVDALLQADAHLDITEALDPWTPEAAVTAITEHWAAMNTKVCDSSIEADPACVAWGGPPSPWHGCKKHPDHVHGEKSDRGHECRCGRTWRSRGGVPVG